MDDLTDRGAVVTGGGSGIGRALCLALARAGCDVVVGDIEKPAAERVAGEVAALGRRGVAVEVDVSRADAVEALAEQAFRSLGAVHVLCNNAGVFTSGPVVEAGDADWQWLLGVNVMGVVHGVRSFVPRMRAQSQGGHVVNTASLAGLIAPPELGVYTTTKYAVMALSETLLSELRPHAIGVSVLCPGVVRTRIFEAGRNRPDAYGGPDPTRAGGELLEQHGQDPARAAEEVVRAIRRDQLYVFTHPEARAVVEARFERILADYRELSERYSGA